MKMQSQILSKSGSMFDQMKTLGCSIWATADQYYMYCRPHDRGGVTGVNELIPVIWTNRDVK